MYPRMAYVLCYRQIPSQRIMFSLLTLRHRLSVFLTTLAREPRYMTFTTGTWHDGNWKYVVIAVVFEGQRAIIVVVCISFL